MYTVGRRRSMSSPTRAPERNPRQCSSFYHASLVAPARCPTSCESSARVVHLSGTAHSLYPPDGESFSHAQGSRDTSDHICTKVQAGLVSSAWAGSCQWIRHAETPLQRTPTIWAASNHKNTPRPASDAGNNARCQPRYFMLTLVHNRRVDKCSARVASASICDWTCPTALNALSLFQCILVSVFLPLHASLCQRANMCNNTGQYTMYADVCCLHPSCSCKRDRQMHKMHADDACAGLHATKAVPNGVKVPKLFC